MTLKHVKISLLVFALGLLMSVAKAQIQSASIPYEVPDYGAATGTVTTNCASKQISTGVLRVTVWDGADAGLHWVCGSNSGSVPLAITTAAKPDVTVIQDACGNVRVLVVYAKSAVPPTTYHYEIFDFVGNNLVTPSITGDLELKETSDIGIHVDSDQTGNFAIAYTLANGASSKIHTTIGGTNCSSLVFCWANYILNPGDESAEIDPDVSIQQVKVDASAIKYTYLSKNHDTLFIRGEKHPGPNVNGFCFDTPLPNSAKYTYIAQPGYKLYSPRIAAPKEYFTSSIGDDYTVVFLEKEVTGTANKWYIRGYTWQWPGPNPILLCDPLNPTCNGIKTYNNSNGITSPANFSPSPDSLHWYESEYPVVTYTDENPNKGILIGWNAKYPSPNSGGATNWDPVVINLNIDGQSLAPAPNNQFFQVPEGVSVPTEQKALSIDGRFSDDGASSIQYSLYDLSPQLIRGKFTPSFPNIILRQAPVTTTTPDKSAISTITVFPNPVESKLTVNFSASAENGKLVIYSVLGTVVKEININGNESRVAINTDKWVSGTYFIQLLSKKNKMIGKETFVKQ